MKRTLILALTTCCALTATSWAAVAGAWETFFDQIQTDAWSVYDYATDDVYFPTSATSDADPYAYFDHWKDYGLWFYTGVLGNAGNGAFVGNYQAEQIQAIQAEIYIDDLAKFDFIDCTIHTRVGGSSRDLFSTALFDTEFTGDGWWTVSFPLEGAEWFYLNRSNQYVPITLTGNMLKQVKEIGFRFFPKEGTKTSLIAALDNVVLEPLVVEPELTVWNTANQFKLSFWPARANIYHLQKLDTTTSPMTWQDVVDDITGPNKYTFSTPLAGKGIYRVGAEAYYTPIFTPALLSEETREPAPRVTAETNGNAN